MKNIFVSQIRIYARHDLIRGVFMCHTFLISYHFLFQIIDQKLYRDKDCHFPSRCAGVEHYLNALAPNLPNMEFVINTRDWPQINRKWGHQRAPVFSFSKVDNFFIVRFAICIP